MTEDHRGPQTLPLGGAKDGATFRRFQLEVIAGADVGAAMVAAHNRCSIGTQDGNDLVLSDPTVSRFHCEISTDGRRFAIRDLGSRNGTRADGVHIERGSVASGAVLSLGHSRIRIESTDEEGQIAATESGRFGGLVGESPAMRQAFAKLELAAASDATVLIEGETGTGKEGAADGLHAHSQRADGPLVVLDCGAIPPNLIESELFGHEAGAFTGATGKRAGAFEEAHGGTLFLDEIGELGLELQPKLLRALESKTVSRIGSRQPIQCDVRVVAATNRDLRAEVNDGRFRADLYYRLAVVRIELPPLRERAGDMVLLVRRLLTTLGADDDQLAALTDDAFVASLERARWPGNVRELRNHLEHCLVMREASAPEPAALAAEEATDAASIDVSLPYDEARRRSIEAFERGYAMALLKAHDGRVAPAARAAGMNRAYLYRLLKRHDIR